MIVQDCEDCEDWFVRSSSFEPLELRLYRKESENIIVLREDIQTCDVLWNSAHSELRKQVRKPEAKKRTDEIIINVFQITV